MFKWIGNFFKTLFKSLNWILILILSGGIILLVWLSYKSSAQEAQ